MPSNYVVSQQFKLMRGLHFLLKVCGLLGLYFILFYLTSVIDTSYDSVLLRSNLSEGIIGLFSSLFNIRYDG